MDEELTTMADVAFEAFHDHYNPNHITPENLRPLTDHLFAPLDRQAASDQFDFLETHGEGVYRLAFGVADREGTLARAASMGYPTARLMDGFDMNPEWRDRFRRIDEARLADEVTVFG